jgi:hypothetical protein
MDKKQPSKAIALGYGLELPPLTCQHVPLERRCCFGEFGAFSTIHGLGSEFLEKMVPGTSMVSLWGLHDAQ